ncbi:MULTISPECIES: homogentisate 1,2-dioxygenase [Elizabethkingia]|uniref:Homogentisate 1,2-dioxygenase n=2 Tax=Elizabethkingia anophelis TaxID=1117645 RepID=A0A494J835_9FLAO|nr:MULTISPECIES: homogentisate 1,2-dioxygenase [Elizabethkingia]AQX51041.1 homogentisate 1,2-dioxygenase [Elizabethkingia anophelis]ATC37949.1 homogentisate 1,2-dioxygenase [Elizabethkingia anophelis R26]ATC41628.1 homogentisate 1,2-dioxygenase [Elizabethkingia anophelis Ag1]ATC45306.1 homogentisate 1,2-dioxygenase [Elizabethkingia anophelis]ATC48982.1 homogentisate 1,2-dioxygenase [Elizabethkingia anophelis]
MRYHHNGKIPQKRHTIFKSEEGNFYYEQLFGTEGFHGISSLLYHTHRPTQIKEIKGVKDVTPKIAVEKNIIPRRIQGMKVQAEDDFLDSRKVLMLNNDLKMGIAKPRKSVTEYFYKNAECDELLFVQKGSGILKTFVGNLEFGYGDYLIIPRGTIYQIEFKDEDNILFFIESHSPIYTPKRYRNEFGQLLEHSPFCERDIEAPVHVDPIDKKGDFVIKVKKENQITDFVYATHPFDVVGWDGYFYPFKFNIKNFEPITGRIHQPPPVHQTFEGHNFVVCSFVARMYDYHPLSIPAPYNHSNIDSDEVLFYAEGDFMSRNHIDLCDFTLHPGGIVHGPHPGAMERSIGQKETHEYAVMVDPFRPLKLTEEALKVEDPTYKTSWLD